MPRIVLCCAAGMSTSMLVNKMTAEAQQRALALEIYAVPVAEFERELPNADVILLGPQVKYEGPTDRACCPARKSCCGNRYGGLRHDARGRRS